MSEQKSKKIAIILSYCNIFISNIIGIIYTPIVLGKLGNDEYGLYSFCSAIVEYLAIFNLGYGSAYVRFYSHYIAEKNEKKIEKLNITILVVYIVLGCILFAIGAVLGVNIEWIIGNKFEDAEIKKAGILVLILTLNLAITMPLSVFSSMISTYERFVFLRIVEIIKNILLPVFSIGILFAGYKSIGLAVVVLLVTISLAIVQMRYCLNNLKLQFKINCLDCGLIKEILVFSVFILIQSVMDCINWQVDKLILGRVCGGSEITYYTLGSKINNMIMNFAFAIYPIFIPKVHKLIQSEKDFEKVSILFAKVGKIQFIIISYICIMFIEWGRELINIWLGNGYEKVYMVAILLSIPMIIQLSEALGIEIIRSKGKQGGLNVIYVCVCIFNIAVSIPLAKAYGSVGAAFGTFIVSICINIIITNIYYAFVVSLKIQYWLKEIFRVIPCLIIIVILGELYKYSIASITVLHICICFMLQLLIYIGLIFPIALSKEDKDIFNGK